MILLTQTTMLSAKILFYALTPYHLLFVLSAAKIGNERALRQATCLPILHNKLVLQCTESSLGDWFLIFNHIRRVLAMNTLVLPRSNRSPVTPWCYIRLISIVVVRLACGNRVDYPGFSDKQQQKTKTQSSTYQPLQPTISVYSYTIQCCDQ